MRYQRRPTGAQQRLTRRFIGWVWHTDHDDRVPNVVNATIVIAMAIVMFAGATSVWLILGMAAAFVTAVLLADVMTSPIRRPSGQGGLDNSVPLHRSFQRSSDGRS